jgi:hypothetical protein
VKAINSLFETARPMLYRHKYYIECGMVGDIKIQINTNDLLRIDIVKQNDLNESVISFTQFLV